MTDRSHQFRNSRKRPAEISAHGHLAELRKRVSLLEGQKDIFLLLSNDITLVRDKQDLVNLFSARLKPQFKFSHTIVMLIDHKTSTYTPFLLDPKGTILLGHPEYEGLTTMSFSLNEPVVGKIMDAQRPLVYVLDDILQTPDLPSFVRVNYECGVKEMLIAPLKNKNELIGFSLVYAKETGILNNDFQELMHRIAPQLSNAVSNIILNEEVRQKQYVNSVLLDLSRELVSIRNWKDLLSCICAHLKKLIHFDSCLMTVMDENGETYKVILREEDAAADNHPQYREIISGLYPVQDGIYDLLAASEQPAVFNMQRTKETDGPLWYLSKYHDGCREMLFTSLPGDQGANRSLILFSRQEKRFDGYATQIVSRLIGELGTVAENIAANEQILRKDWETSFLLDFGNEIATVRSQDDFAAIVKRFLKKLDAIKGYAIRLINDDGKTMTTYIHDNDVSVKDDPLMLEVTTARLPLNDGIQDRVLQSSVPLTMHIEEEIAKGDPPVYVGFWKSIGLRKIVGTPLHMASKSCGILWLGMDEIHAPLVHGICSLISIAIANIKANEQVILYKQKLEHEKDHLHEQLNSIYNFSEIVGEHDRMRDVYRLISRVAGSPSSVMILGETGTGKELIARAIHHASPRKSKVMIKVNCAAMPPNLIESELFGHEKGAFTGAFERRIGKFELANQSTLFLDEIGELPLDLQVKLLRVLQEREFERIGGKNTIKVDVRIITATNRNLEMEVAAGRFRSDLYYRLNVFPIPIPALRDRKEDVVPLARFFIGRYSKQTGISVTGMTPEVAKKLTEYEWPGNVRELEHLIERSVLLTNSNVLKEVHLPAEEQKSAEVLPDQLITMEEKARQHIIITLKRCSGKIGGEGGAAEILDIPATTLHTKMKKLQITKKDYL
jgi:transcriptional regulator with GAF, ATPase, and Fis domain